MKPSLAIILCFASVATFVQGETFIGPTTAINRLLVSSNSAIIITTTLGDFTNSTQIAQGVGGLPSPLYYFSPLANGTDYALAGPAVLVFSNAALITYYVLTNSTISTQTIAHDPISILIASNQTFHLFGVPAPVHASFAQAGSGSVGFTLGPNQPAEFSGPGKLTLNIGMLAPYIGFISYFIEEDGFTLPNQRATAGPTGSYAVTVEKSFDLNTWSPVLLTTTSDANQAFYRLKIQH
jgi:hypothetical protein